MSRPIVETKQGKLCGTLRTNIDGGTYIAYRGIPYAKPPVGELRFKDPQPPEPWEGVRDAINESKACAQYDILSDVKEGSDDCLYLDVSTIPLSGKMPVIVWIHGGAFKKSSNTVKKYSPDYLLKKDIVFVSINYRLGLLGFLNMEHDECSGNMGLKDQIAALKWVQENIEAFNGDHMNVTIFGESAGGASVHALCISQAAKGLFHKAIIQSGSLFNPWASISSNSECGYALAKTLGNSSSDALQVISFLRTVPALELVEIHEKMNKMETLKLTLTLVPTEDDKSKSCIFPQPFNVMKKHTINVPLLIGYNSHEGILRFIGMTPDQIENIDDHFEPIVSEYLGIPTGPRLTAVANIVRKFYFGEDRITCQKIDELVQFFGDMLFVTSIQAIVDIQEQNNLLTYLYKFSYEPDYPGIKDMFDLNMKGACHGDELGCLFYSKKRRGKLVEGTRDYLTMERMTTMWTNFAKYGNPTPTIDELIPVKWEPIKNNKRNYLEINDELTCGKNPDKNMWKMWKSLL